MTIENKVGKPNKGVMNKTLEHDIQEREEIRDEIKPLRDEIRTITKELSNQKVKSPELIERRKELYIKIKPFSKPLLFLTRRIASYSFRLNKNKVK